MNVQISEIKLIELFIEVDDLFNAYLEYRKSIGDAPRKPTRVTGLTGPEVCTILVAYHYSGYKCFEYFYRKVVLDEHADCFPMAPTYKRFLGLIPRAADLVYLWLLYSVGRADRTGLYFIDSKKLQACHLKREHSNKVFKGVAAKGKTSTGWFFGLKIHLVINNLGDCLLRPDPGERWRQQPQPAQEAALLARRPLRGRQGLPHGAFQLLPRKRAAPDYEAEEEHEATASGKRTEPVHKQTGRD